MNWDPVQEKLLDDASKPVGNNDILYVNVAGGRGHDLLDFKQKFPNYPGRYVLMDLSHVVEDKTLNLSGVEKRSFDFFQDQVVLGKLSSRPRPHRHTAHLSQTPASTT